MPARSKQVEIIVFRVAHKKFEFLLLKRNRQKGGFWQPITGGVRDGEGLIHAVRRELREETGIDDYLRIYENVYQFEFDTVEHETLKEYVFGVHVSANTNVALSPEHTAMKWCTLEEANKLLKHDGNKIGFKLLYKMVADKRNNLSMPSNP